MADMITFTISTKATFKFAYNNGDCRNARDIGYYILDQCQEEIDDGFALKIFEQALDWGLGLGWIQVMRSYKGKRKPREITLQVTSDGKIYLKGKIKSILLS